jgi:hypothetical protein
VSAERFFDTYLGAGDLSNMLDRWRGNERKSPPRTMAERLIAESGEALTDMYDLQYGLRRVGADRRAGFRLNAATLLFGISIVSIEEALKTAMFDSRDVTAMFENATKGRLSFNFPPDFAPYPEYINHGDWLQMIYAASDDKKLSVFFKEPNLMPKTLYKALQVDRGVMPLISGKIMPSYDRMMESVLGAPSV